ncbi:nitroreductase family deazaflavin-dependent oxidoreductase [Cellulomonas taurus]|uniref:nitroreductase family deazaflavin-dependent oxidoreductase n=1 Tax=Cellulomonas taurus TaxID=2729175 RepID=UPI00145C704D|nr:nitroreductase family deazaflavin-dependent oxidoreductase [Cellulomonas taurus]
MAITGEYQPSPEAWVRDQVETIERSGGTEGTELRGMPVVVVTMLGAKSGKVRKIPVMRVEHDGVYAVVASLGGAPKNPGWYANLVAHPEVDIQDATHKGSYRVREISGEEYALWWERAVAAYPDYADYQTKTDRVIPVFLAEPLTD